MSVWTRILWFLVVVSLVGGAVLVVSVSRSRSAAAEDLRAATRRLDDLREDAKEQPIRINQIREDNKERLRLTRECFIVIALQSAALRRFFNQLPTGSATSPELERYTDVARDMMLGFRQLLDDCEGT